MLAWWRVHTDPQGERTPSKRRSLGDLKAAFNAHDPKSKHSPRRPR